MKQHLPPYHILAVLCLSIIFCCTSKSSAQEPRNSSIPIFTLPSNDSLLEVGQGIQYYEDVRSLLTIDSLAAPSFAGKWKTSPQNVFSAGFKRSTTWLRFALRNAAPQHNDWLLEIAFPSLDSIEVFRQEADGSFSRHLMGDYLPFSQREIQFRTYVHHLAMPDSLPHVFYLRIKTTSSTIVPITLHRTEEFIEYSNRWQIFYGWLFGALMILIIYHVILFAFTREKSYVSYILYLFGVLFWITTFNGFTAEYLLPNNKMLLQYCMLWSIVVSLLGLVLFTQSFLSVAQHTPRLNVILRGLALCFVVMILAVPFVDYLTANIVYSASILPSVVVCYGTAFVVIRRVQSRQYQYFLVGSLSLLVGGSIAALMALGIIPNNNLTRNSVQIGAVLESVLFSIALSQRYKILQNEKESAQEENLRLIRDANETLQRAVRERTAELNEKNADLESANEEIQRQMEIQTEQAREIELSNTALQEKNERLNALNMEKNELMGIVAHDLKNPIGAVRGLADLIYTGFAEGEQVQEITGSIVHTADRMLELVKNLLDVNQLESGGMQFQTIPFDIAPMLESTIWQYTQPATAKNISLHLSNEGAPSMVVADEQAMMQVLDNIISNAVKYSPHGKNVFVRVKASNEAIRVEIQDEGPGISPDDMKKLFGKFARLSARPTGGEHSTGLGLSIVKKMVEAMQGRVWCESELGKGATFIVELPSNQ